MERKPNILLVPGLENLSALYKIVGIYYGIFGAQVNIAQTDWKTGESYLHEWLNLQSIVRRNSPELMLAISAGARIGIDVFGMMPNQIKRVATIDGWMANHDKTNEEYAIRLTANYAIFEEAIRQSDPRLVLDDDLKRRVTTYRSMKSGVVPEAAAQIDGAKNIVVDTEGHIRTIAKVLFTRASEIVNLAKKS